MAYHVSPACRADELWYSLRRSALHPATFDFVRLQNCPLEVRSPDRNRVHNVDRRLLQMALHTHLRWQIRDSLFSPCQCSRKSDFGRRARLVVVQITRALTDLINRHRTYLPLHGNDLLSRCRRSASVGSVPQRSLWFLDMTSE